VDLLSTTCHVYFGLKTAQLRTGARRFPPIRRHQSGARLGPEGPHGGYEKPWETGPGPYRGNASQPAFIPSTLPGNRVSRNWRASFGDISDGRPPCAVQCRGRVTLRDAQKRPEAYRNLLVPGGGYFRLLCRPGPESSEEIIARTAQEGLLAIRVPRDQEAVP
jgi:hypothetical protein